jgi:hypothetical protein
MRIRVVGFGYSHLLSVRHAASSQSFAARDISVETVVLNDPEVQAIGVLDTRTESLSDEFKRWADAKVASADLCFLYLATNAHQVFGLCRHPIPFDFVLRSNPELPLEPDCQIVSSLLVEQALQKQGGFPESIRTLRAFRAHFGGGNLAECAIPPVISNNEFIEQNAHVFREAIARYGVGQKYFRFKIWSLYSEIFARECERLDVPYIGVPEGMMDHEGFLAEGAWGPDATHANNKYGGAVIAQLLRRQFPGISLPE